MKAKIVAGKKEESKIHEENQTRPVIIEEEDEERKVVKIENPVKVN